MDDRLFRQIAETYVHAKGEELKRENAALAKEQHNAPTPALDNRVLGYIRQEKHKRTFRIAATLAASVILVLSAALVLEWSNWQSTPFAQDSSPGTAATSPAPGELIPLSFTLPEEFTVAEVKLDNGKTIYTLEEGSKDDVIMTLEYVTAGSSDAGLKPIEINGYQAYGKIEDGYRLILLTKDNITYTLTCINEFETILRLSRAILI